MPETERCIISIVKVPEGAAPLAVREAWVGLIMVGYPLEDDDVEVDLLTLDPIHRRQGYFIGRSYAEHTLESRSPVAARWYRENVSPSLNAYTFAADEVEVLDND